MSFFAEWFKSVDISSPIRKQDLEQQLVSSGFDSKEALLGMTDQDRAELAVLPGDRAALRTAIQRLAAKPGTFDDFVPIFVIDVLIDSVKLSANTVAKAPSALGKRVRTFWGEDGKLYYYPSFSIMILIYL